MVRSLFFFDEMIFPKIMTFIYWIALIALVASAFTMGFFQGILVIIFGAIGIRIWFELIVVMFKINEALQEIRKK